MIGNLTRLGCVDSENASTYCVHCCYLVRLGCEEDHQGLFSQLIDRGEWRGGAACEGCGKVVIEATSESEEAYVDE